MFQQLEGRRQEDERVNGLFKDESSKQIYEAWKACKIKKGKWKKKKMSWTKENDEIWTHESDLPDFTHAYIITLLKNDCISVQIKPMIDLRFLKVFFWRRH